MRKKKPNPITLTSQDQLLRQQEVQRATAEEMIKRARGMRKEALEMRNTTSSKKKVLP
jgi:hypothetical protein